MVATTAVRSTDAPIGTLHRRVGTQWCAVSNKYVSRGLALVALYPRLAVRVELA